MATGHAVNKTTFLQVDDRVYSKLAAAITAAATSLTVTLADAGLFPDLYPYILTIEDERVLVTNRVSNTLTITRAYDGTTAATHAKNTYIALNIVSRSVSDLNAAVNTIEQALVDGITYLKIYGSADNLLDFSGGTVNSGGAEIRLSNNAVIRNTTNGRLELETSASGYVRISEGNIIAKCDYVDLDLDVALRFIGAGLNIDGNVIFRDNVTIGRSGAAVTTQVYGGTTDIRGTVILEGTTRMEPTSAVDYALRISGTAILNSGEQAIYINVPNETTATNGIWITLKSTVTSGDLTGIRSRVYGNAASAGANVRGAYLEAKMEASKYVAQLEGALIHADYSAGSVTVSGDVRGLTVHISQGASLNAANLYGILLNIQTRSDETITTDDVGLLIRNEAVGGNGRTMNAAIKIAELNMGGGTNGFTDDIIFHKTSHIRDETGYLTIYGTAGYVRIGDAQTTEHSLASEDSLMVTADLEVYGIAYIDDINVGSGSLTIATTGSNYGLLVKSTNDDATGAILGLYHISTTPAANDQIGVLKVYGYDDDSPQNLITAGQWITRWTSPANGAETTYMEFYLRNSGASNKAMTVSGAGLLWVDAGIDVDGANVDNVAIIYGNSTYVRIGDAGTTSHSLAAEDDQMVTGKLEVDGEVYLDGAVWLGGRITIGGPAVLDYYYNQWAGTWTSGGASNKAAINYIGGAITGASGDTAYLVGTRFDCSVVTQTATESIGIIAQVYIDEPDITDNLTGDITVAASLYIVAAPSEGEQNAAIYIASGDLVMTAGFIDLTEIAAPGAGAANTARIYALEGAGDGFTDLCAVFQDGSIDVFAQETTEPDSPIFEFPDDTPLALTMRKPDQKTVQFVATFPDGREFVMREIRYPSPRWN